MVIDLTLHGSQADLADLVGVTQPAISQLMTAGKIPASGTLGELVRAYVRHMQQQADIRQGSGLLDLVQERAALARTQREGHEIKNTALLGEYAPTPLLTDVMRVVSDSMTANLDQLERTLPVKLPGLPADALRVVHEVIASARAEWIRSTSELACRRPVTEGDDAEEDRLHDHGWAAPHWVLSEGCQTRVI
ncbi:MAG: hypothetical protein JWR74_2822 [Polaromonas sp.]|nr:hypothetical protein [Polaromonas sp.]